jgi:hypothetical protein
MQFKEIEINVRCHNTLWTIMNCEHVIYLSMGNCIRYVSFYCEHLAFQYRNALDPIITAYTEKHAVGNATGITNTNNTDPNYKRMYETWGRNVWFSRHESDWMTRLYFSFMCMPFEVPGISVEVPTSFLCLVALVEYTRYGCWKHGS